MGGSILARLLCRGSGSGSSAAQAAGQHGDSGGSGGGSVAGGCGGMVSWTRRAFGAFSRDAPGPRLLLWRSPVDGSPSPPLDSSKDFPVGSLSVPESRLSLLPPPPGGRLEPTR